MNNLRVIKNCLIIGYVNDKRNIHYINKIIKFILKSGFISSDDD